MDDDLRPEYQRSDLGKGVRGKHYQAYQQGTNVVLLDPADYLVTDEDVITFLEDMAENGTPTEFMHGLRTAMRSHGMLILTQKLGEEKTALCQTLANQENPSFALMYRAVEALGLHLALQQVA